ncbi:MAG: tetratricopeptide repeat protein [Promethearchaeota archaeon]
MKGQPCDELARAEELLKSGEYNQALEIVHSLSPHELEPADSLHCLLLECKLRIKLGGLEKAARVADKALEIARQQENELLTADFLLIKVELAWRSGKFDEGFLICPEIENLLQRQDSGLEEIEESELKRREAQLIHHCGILNWYKGDLDRAGEYHEESLEVYRELGDKTGEASALNNLGLVQWSKGNLDAAAEYYEESLSIRRELGIPYEIAVILNNLGNVLVMKGDLESALDYHNQALHIRETLDNKPDLATSLTNVGAVYQTRGSLNQALECYHRALEIYKEIDVKQGMALILNNLGSAYEIRGNLIQSLDYHQRSLEIRKGLGNKQDIALSLLNIGGIHRQRGEPELALKTLQQSLELFKESGNDPYTAAAYYFVITVAIENNDFEVADDALHNLQELNERTSNRIIDQRYRVARAIRLKAGQGAREKLEAQGIFAEIIQEEVVQHTLIVTAMIHLCDLLLFEFKMTGDEDLFERAKDITQQILGIAKSQMSYSLLAEAYILQSKFALVEQDIEKARILLSQAHIMTQEKDLYILARKVAHERDLLQLEVDKWQKIIERNPSRKEMIDFAQLDDYLERMIKKTVAVLTADEKKEFGDEAVKEKYRLAYSDLLEGEEAVEKTQFRVGIAQIGLSQNGDLLGEYYEEFGKGLLVIQKDRIDEVRAKVEKAIDEANKTGVNVLLFPEMTIDLNYPELVDEVTKLAKKHRMYIIPGSFHEEESKQNLCRVIGPTGVIWEQVKHIPAIIHLKGRRFTEGIDVGQHPRNTIVCNTEYGRMAIVICRDFLDMDLRVELKNFNPPIDLVLNPAFTPVTADFDAAHFDARRSIYAYCFFANVAEFGDSLIYTPEKEKIERKLPAREEGLIYKDVDLFQLRSERKKWEKERRRFIQSTRS